MPKIEQMEDGKKVKIQLEGGEVFEGDWLTATQKLAEAQENTKKWGQGLKSEVETLKAQPRPEPVKPTVNPEEVQLQQYLADQQAKFLGYENASQYKEEMTRAKRVIDDTANRAVAAEFMNQCPDFPNTSESIDKLAKKMDEMGYDYTPQSMIAAHMLCIREQSYKPLTAEEQNATWLQGLANADRQKSPPPPMVRSGSPEVSQASPANDPNTMPLDQLRQQYMNRYFQEQQR